MRRLAIPLVLAVLAGCGGDDGSDGPRATVERYLKALGDGDAKGACAELTEASRKTVARSTRGETCDAALAGLLKVAGAKGRAKLGDAEVKSVETKGDTATVKVDAIPDPLALERSGGTWRLKSAGSG